MEAREDPESIHILKTEVGEVPAREGLIWIFRVFVRVGSHSGLGAYHDITCAVVFCRSPNLRRTQSFRPEGPKGPKGPKGRKGQGLREGLHGGRCVPR